MTDEPLVIEPLPPYTYPTPAVALQYSTLIYDKSNLYVKSNVYDKSREEFFISYTLFFEDVVLENI